MLSTCIREGVALLLSSFAGRQAAMGVHLHNLRYCITLDTVTGVFSIC